MAQKREDRALGALVVVAHERIYPGGQPGADGQEAGIDVVASWNTDVVDAHTAAGPEKS